ncbi:hypothetical protein UlMin_034902 [Ulmus minor]
MKKAHSQNKFLRIIALPFRALGKARDLYVRSMTNSAQRISVYGSSMGGPAGQFEALPKSSSVRTSRGSDYDDDYAELVRAASARSYGNTLDMETILRQHLEQMMQSAPATATTTAGSTGLPKSSSVGMGRIDEDQPCEFGDQDGGGDVKPKLYPRSKSYAVSKRNVVFG